MAAQRPPLSVKAVGESRLRAGSLDDLLVPEQRLIGGGGRMPLPTGLLTVDLAIGIGGLPRRRLTVVSATRAERSDHFVFSVIAETQRGGGRVAVVDLTRDIKAPQLRSTVVDYAELGLVRVPDVDSALDAAARLAAGGGYDLVVVNATATARGTEQLVDALDELDRRAQDATAAVLVNLGSIERRRNLAGRGFLQLDLTAVPRPAATGVVESIVRLEGGSPDTVRISQFPDSTVVPHLEAAELLPELDVLAGRRDRAELSAPEVGRYRRRVLDRFANEPELVESVRADIHRRLSHARLLAATAAAPPAPPRGRFGQQQQDRPHPAGPLESDRFVQTWFECDREPVLPLVVGRTYEFVLRISNASAESTTPFVEPDWGDKYQIELLATVLSHDFDIAVASKSFTLFRYGDAQPVAFAVSPRRPDTARLRILLNTAVELELLQELEVDVEVRADEAVVSDASR